jgi:type IV secretory pathway VirD2 relaxase
MEAVRESWTDERLDDLKDQVVEQGRRTDDGFRELRSEMTEMRSEMNGRFDANQRTTVQLFGIALGAFVGLISVQTALLLALL